MKNLISIQEYSDYLNTGVYKEPSERWRLHRNRVNFGRQKLEIYMFVPCKLVDGVWVVLEEPMHYKLWCKYGSYTQYGEKIVPECKEYQEAKERCIFEGWKLTKNDPEHIKFKKGQVSIIFYIESEYISFYEMFCDSEDVSTIEDLVKYNLKLTASAQKQIEG